MIAHSNSVLGVAGRAVAVGAVVFAFAFGLSDTRAYAAVSGSYQRSCKNIVDDGVSVNASCKRKNGTYNNSAHIAYHICQGDTIWNNNGNLQCTPMGSFKNSCNMISWNESFLTANCRRINGQYIMNGGFNYNSCLTNSQDIANIDGSLRCQ